MTIEEVESLLTKQHRYFRCKCDCGRTAIVAQAHLKSGHTQSCGCRSHELSGARTRRHGHAGNSSSGVRATSEYGIWQNMKRRCNDPTVDSYPYYGGRGIRVCERWMNSFKAFLEDMGHRPSKQHSIDRIDNDGHYEPGNVRWATMTEQRLNSRKPSRHVRPPSLLEAPPA